MTFKEQCEILDNFHSMSERARVRDTYYQRADSVSKQLYNELSRLIHEAKLRLNYSKLYYPSLIVNFGQAHDMFSRIFQTRIYEFFSTKCYVIFFFSNAQKWAKIPFLTNNEFVFLFNKQILVKKFKIPIRKIREKMSWTR